MIKTNHEVHINNNNNDYKIQTLNNMACSRKESNSQNAPDPQHGLSSSHSQVSHCPSSPVSSNSRPCCRCNGVNARCKFCACAKAKLPSSGCLPARRGRCHNTTGLASSSQSPSSHRLDHSSQQSSSPPSTQQLAQHFGSQQLSPLPHPPEGSQSSRTEHWDGPILSSRSHYLPATSPQQPFPHSSQLSLPAYSQQPSASPPPSSTGRPQQFPTSSMSPPAPSIVCPLSPILLLQQSSLPPPVYSSQPPLQVLPAEQLPGFPPATHEGSSSVPTRKQCIVEGCLARVAPSMWHNHMPLHAKGALPGEVSSDWMKNQNLCICPSCSQLVSCSRRALHHSHCCQRQSTHVLPTNVPPTLTQPQVLPTFKQVCQLNHLTLRFIPSKARPAFAIALSSALREVIHRNTEEAWLKLLMLPKCVLPSMVRRGSHAPHTSIESLCNLWLCNDLSTLWAMAQNREIKPSSRLTQALHPTIVGMLSILQFPLVVQVCSAKHAACLLQKLSLPSALTPGSYCRPNTLLALLL